MVLGKMDLMVFLLTWAKCFRKVNDNVEMWKRYTNVQRIKLYKIGAATIVWEGSVL